MRLSIAVVLFIVSLSAEAGMIRDWFAQHSPVKSDSEIKKLIDIPYGDDKKQGLDLYLPSYPLNAPIIVMVHGGAWKAGDKKSDNVVQNKMERWVGRGVIFVSLNYRLIPNATVSDQVDDIARALAYVQSHSTSWGGDPDKIVLMGHSAGAHLVSLLSSDMTRYSHVGLKPWKGTVSLDTATMDLLQTMERKHYDFYDDVFGTDRENWIANSPLYQLERSAPPMLLVCSTLREDKPCENSIPFMQKGSAMGLRIEMSEQPFSHAQINDELGKANGYTQRVEEFMKSVGIELQ